jgi:hypothetical protein
MPYIVKMRKVRAYVTNFYKRGDEYNVSYHKHINKAKIWKTEKGVKVALNKYLKSSNEKPKHFMVVEKSNSELGIFEYGKSTITYKNKPKLVMKKKFSFNKIKIFKFKKINIKGFKLKENTEQLFKYIKGWIINLKNDIFIK